MVAVCGGIGIFLVAGYGVNWNNAGSESVADTVTMEQLFDAQDIEKLVDYYGDVWYEFQTFYPEGKEEYMYYFVGDDMYIRMGETDYELWRDDKYFYAKDKAGYYAGVSGAAFHNTEEVSSLFDLRRGYDIKQKIIETSLNADNLSIVTTYENDEFIQSIAEQFGLTYDKDCKFQSTYIVDSHTLAVYAGEDKYISSDGTEYVCMKYNASYSYDKNTYPDGYLDLEARMEAVENITKYTIVFEDNGERVTDKMNVVKGDSFVWKIGDEKYALYYDEQGLNPVERNSIISEEDSMTIYILEKK